jgi:hypothetical protein
LIDFKADVLRDLWEGVTGILGPKEISGINIVVFGYFCPFFLSLSKSLSSFRHSGIMVGEYRTCTVTLFSFISNRSCTKVE